MKNKLPMRKEKMVVVSQSNLENEISVDANDIASVDAIISKYKRFINDKILNHLGNFMMLFLLR